LIEEFKKIFDEVREDRSLSRLKDEDVKVIWSYLLNKMSQLDRAKMRYPSVFVRIDDRYRFVLPEELRTVLGILPNEELECFLHPKNNPQAICIMKK
jgi:hypothetical protein